MERREKFVGLRALALLLLQATEAHGGTEFPGLGLLAAGNSQGLLEAGFSLSHIRSGPGQQAPPFLDVTDIPEYNPSGGH